MWRKINGDTILTEEGNPKAVDRHAIVLTKVQSNAHSILAQGSQHMTPFSVFPLASHLSNRISTVLVLGTETGGCKGELSPRHDEPAQWAFVGVLRALSRSTQTTTDFSLPNSR